jgi:hypothetical protein
MKNGTIRNADMVDVQKIKTSELRYRRLFEAAQDGILLLDAQTGATIYAIHEDQLRQSFRAWVGSFNRASYR